MILVLALMIACYAWLCWSGYRFVQKYNRLLQEVVPEYVPEMFPYVLRPVFKLGLVGVMTIHSSWAKRLAEFLTRELISMPRTSRTALLRKIDVISW